MENSNSLKDLKVNNRLEKNIEAIEQILEKNSDLIKRDFVFHGPSDIRGAVFFIDGLVNVDFIDKQILTPLMIYSGQLRHTDPDAINHRLANSIKEHLILHASVELVDTFDKVILAILSGDTAMFLDHTNQAFIMSTKGWDSRNVSEPETESVVRGPRDGFTENLRTNTSLLRRRIRDHNFKLEAMKVGEKSKTDINIAYVKGIVKDNLVEEVKKRLQNIKIDLILESGYIEELIEDAPLSPFTTVQSTERPDKVASALYEGRVAIFVDNTPFVLIVPSYFWQYVQASDDYYSRYWVGSFFRLIRYIAFLLSLTLPSLYVLVTSFHHEMIPTPLALTIAAGREANPFPVLVEALVMEISFELMREAGLRMPKPIGVTVSVIGSLVVGQAAVQAGIVSPFMLIIVAVTGIASFAIPNYAASFSIRLLRFPLLIAAGTLGLSGFSAILAIIFIHTLSLRSFGEPYLAPISPFLPGDQKDTLFRVPWWKMEKRPTMAGNERREKADQIPKPPNQTQEPSDSMSKPSGQKSNFATDKKQKENRTWRKKKQ